MSRFIVGATGIPSSFQVILTACLFAVAVLAGDEEAAQCGHCIRENCSAVESCPESMIIQDKCNCCNICRTDVNYPRITKETREEICRGVSCPSDQLCMLNIQGLPICRCPSVYNCPRRQKKVCGNDGVTYKSRCHIKVAECNFGKKIRIVDKAPCPGYQQPARDDWQSRRAERVARREEKKKLRAKERRRRKRARQQKKHKI